MRKFILSADTTIVFFWSMIFIGLICFCITLAYKWGIIDWYEGRRKRWMPKECIFCLSFWLGSILCASFFLITGKYDIFFSLPLLPIVSAFIMSIQRK